jgi:hypothetical protein
MKHGVVEITGSGYLCHNCFFEEPRVGRDAKVSANLLELGVVSAREKIPVPKTWALGQ